MTLDTLTIHSSRVMKHKEVSNQFLIDIISTGKLHVIDFHMSSLSTADFSIGRICFGTWRAHEADCSIDHRIRKLLIEILLEELLRSPACNYYNIFFEKVSLYVPIASST